MKSARNAQQWTVQIIFEEVSLFVTQKKGLPVKMLIILIQDTLLFAVVQ